MPSIQVYISDHPTLVVRLGHVDLLAIINTLCMKSIKISLSPFEGCVTRLNPVAPPYIIWRPSNAIYRVNSTVPSKVRGQIAGQALLYALQYPTRAVSRWATTVTPPGFTHGPPIQTV